MNHATLIIPAAGSGKRLNRNIPKPYIQLGGKSILEHTVRRFLKLDLLSQIIIATSAEYITEAEAIMKDTVSSGLRFDIVQGGKKRQHSIYNALKKVTESNLVIVHDAVRPFVSPVHIERCCMAAVETGASVLGIPVQDTIKQIGRDGFIQQTPTRNFLWQAQTPQVFKKEILEEAYKKALQDKYTGTDDASLVERVGYPVKMVEGDRRNFKITYPLDLKFAQLLLGEDVGNE